MSDGDSSSRFLGIRNDMAFLIIGRREAGAFRRRVDRVKKNIYETPLLPSSNP